MQTETVKKAEPNAASESAILKSHEKRIRYVALPFVRNGVALEDLTQEGRIGLLHAARSYRADSGVQLWTYAIKFVFGAIVRFSNGEREEPCRKGPGGEASEATFEAIADSSRTPAEALELAECLGALAPELIHLTEEERRVVRMHMVDDLSLREITESRGEDSCVTVQRIYHGAIEKLRELVQVKL